MLSKSYKLILTTIIIVILALVFDLILNIILPEKFKKTIGTTRNYSLKSVKYHHEIAPNIDVYEHWGKKKYRVVTNEHSFRVLSKDSRKINNLKKKIGFIGDSFVYGAGIEYKNHFINILNNKNNKYSLLNLGYVSYSPSIYYKKLKYFLEKKNFEFDKIFLFIDHSDIQDEGLFYRENSKGNIVRKWDSDTEIKNKNKKYFIKNYLKQNSFIFKFYEHFNSPKISEKSKKCILNKEEKNYINYLEPERFGYGYQKEIYQKKWVNEGINNILVYLDKILSLSKEYNFELHIVYYPSGMEILDKIHFISSKHFNFLNQWSFENKINFINTYNEFIQNDDEKMNYLKNFIECDNHWNKNGHNIIANSLLNLLNEKN